VSVISARSPPDRHRRRDLSNDTQSKPAQQKEIKMADPTVSGLVGKLLDNTKEFVDDLLENVEKLESDVTDIAKDTKDSRI
jgi:hypothetical protein